MVKYLESKGKLNVIRTDYTKEEYRPIQTISKEEFGKRKRIQCNSKQLLELVRL